MQHENLVVVVNFLIIPVWRKQALEQGVRRSHVGSRGNQLEPQRDPVMVRIYRHSGHSQFGKKRCGGTCFGTYAGNALEPVSRLAHAQVGQKLEVQTSRSRADFLQNGLNAWGFLLWPDAGGN